MVDGRRDGRRKGEDLLYSGGGKIGDSDAPSESERHETLHGSPCKADVNGLPRPVDQEEVEVRETKLIEGVTAVCLHSFLVAVEVVPQLRCDEEVLSGGNTFANRFLK